MIKLPSQVNKALALLEEAGFEAYAVGGCIRDSLMGEIPLDYDVTTSALPRATERVFSSYKVIETGIKHGTVTVIIDSVPIEITTYRVEGQYFDRRHPGSVCFTKSLREDVARRDFTMNAVAFAPDVGIVDYFGGKKDIEAGVIRCVGNPERRFKEDALRIMRALRFASVTGFEIEEKTLSAMEENKGLLQDISAERVRDELTKLLCGRHAEKCIVENADIIGEVIPEILDMKGFRQCNPHHIHDVLTHSAVAVGAIGATPTLRLATLFHDIGKPKCFSLDSDSVGHFFGHASISAELTEKIMSRLKFDNDTKQKVTELVRLHDLQIESSEKAVKRVLNKISPEMFFDLLQLKRADNLAQSPEYRDRQRYYDELESMAKEIIEKEECFSLRDLAVDGNDLITIGFPQGKEIGKVLAMLLEEVIEGKLSNDREELIKKARYFKQNFAKKA